MGVDRRQADVDRRQADVDKRQTDVDIRQTDVERRQTDVDRWQTDVDRKQTDVDRGQTNDDVRTSTFARFLRDLPENETVRDDDDDERSEVDGDDVEEVVGELVSSRREEVERDTLREPLEHRVSLHVEDDALQEE